MSTLIKMEVVTAIIMMIFCCGLMPERVQASEETRITEESWSKRSNCAGYSAIKRVKEKTREVLNQAEETVRSGKEKFQEWNQDQEDEFWERTMGQLNGETTAESLEDTESPNEAQEEDPDKQDNDRPNESSAEAPEASQKVNQSETSDSEESEGGSDDAGSMTYCLVGFFPLVVFLIVGSSSTKHF